MVLVNLLITKPKTLVLTLKLAPYPVKDSCHNMFEHGRPGWWGVLGFTLTWVWGPILRTVAPSVKPLGTLYWKGPITHSHTTSRSLGLMTVLREGG